MLVLLLLRSWTWHQECFQIYIPLRDQCKPGEFRELQCCMYCLFTPCDGILLEVLVFLMGQFDHEACIIHICFTLSGSRVFIVGMMYAYLVWDFFFQVKDLGTYSVPYQGFETFSLACASMIFLWWCLIGGYTCSMWGLNCMVQVVQPFLWSTISYLQFWLNTP